MDMSYCRFCGKLKSNSELIGILDKNVTDCHKSIGWIIFKCFRITIKPNDSLSQSVCSDCFQQTVSTMKFYEQILKTQKFLKNLYATKKTRQNNENEDNKETASVFDSNVTETENLQIQSEYINENKTDEMVIKKERHSDEYNVIKKEKCNDNDRNSGPILETFNTFSNDAGNSEAVVKKDVYSDEELSDGLMNFDMQLAHDFFDDSKVNESFDADLHLQLISNQSSTITFKESHIVDRKKREYKTRKSVTKKNKKVTKEREKPKSEMQIKRAEMMQKVAEEFSDYVWRCHICSRELKTKPELMNHFKQEHKKPVEFTCMDCSKVFAHFTKFKWHVRRHRRIAEFCCKICDKSFIAECYLRDHIYFVHEYKDNDRIKCPVCNKGYKTKTALQTHDLYVHQGKNEELECDICSKKFKNKHFLRIHKEIHEEKKFICEICGNKFRSKSNLSIHITSRHSNEDGSCTHICTFCSKSFKTSFHLSNHMRRIHQRGFKHQCDICGKKFRTKNTLTEHRTSHTGELPHTCPFCQKKFRLKKTMQVHIRQHTGERPYSCKECDRDFVCVANYLKHKKRKHSGVSKVEKVETIMSS